MIPNVTEVAVDHLLGEVQRLADEDCRLVSITGLDAGEAWELLYHFARECELLHLRVRLPKDRELPSISRIYFCAFVPENELQDMFGIRVACSVSDYGGHFFLSHDAPPHPLAKEAVR
ncbi:MAG TPA: NADH-quinone oxidoreductase subunit C [Firmicutes bacterium]|nr:NADH-quinone oxidoreductase subunit C [Bacillota bacterium]